MFVDSVNFIVNTCDMKKKKNISLSTAERSSKVTQVVMIDCKTL